MLNLLFICSKNKWRSPTAETIYRKDNRVNVRSAGTSDKARKTVSFSDIEWADIIFVMEKKHKAMLERKFSGCFSGKRGIVLDIPDDYQYMDEELVEILFDTVSPHLE